MSDTSPLQKLPNSSDTAISNLTGPITQTAGETIRDCWDLIFGGLRNVAEKKRLRYAASVEQLKKELESKIEDIPANKRTEPDIQVVCGALSDAQYCVDKDELRKMFANLIAASIHSDKLSDVHPSFSRIIRSLSPFDARFLMRSYESFPLPLCTYSVHLLSGGKKEYRCDVTAVNGIVQSDARVSNTLEVLSFLGLIKMDYAHWFMEDALYEAFSKCDIYSEVSRICASNPSEFKEVGIEKGIATLTSIGQKFVRVCIS